MIRAAPRKKSNEYNVVSIRAEVIFMKAVVYEAFSQPPRLMNVEDPTPERHGVVVQVRGTGVCRSDWHG